MSVCRCVCHNVSFKELKRIANETGGDIENLKTKTGCCTDCGMCEPYVRLMLRTGQTQFEPMTLDNIEMLLLKTSNLESSED